MAQTIRLIDLCKQTNTNYNEALALKNSLGITNTNLATLIKMGATNQTKSLSLKDLCKQYNLNYSKAAIYKRHHSELTNEEIIKCCKHLQLSQTNIKTLYRYLNNYKRKYIK